MVYGNGCFPESRWDWELDVERSPSLYYDNEFLIRTVYFDCPPSEISKRPLVVDKVEVEEAFILSAPHGTRVMIDYRSPASGALLTKQYVIHKP